jgi:hypothetical protein
MVVVEGALGDLLHGRVMVLCGCRGIRRMGTRIQRRARDAERQRRDRQEAKYEAKVGHGIILGHPANGRTAIGFPDPKDAPALIGGDRQEFRLAEFVAMRLLRLADPLLPRRYRVVPHERIARALLEAAISAPPGKRIIESNALIEAGG